MRRADERNPRGTRVDGRAVGILEDLATILADDVRDRGAEVVAAGLSPTVLRAAIVALSTVGRNDEAYRLASAEAAALL